MKMAMAALAAVLMAQAAPAMAQERGERGDRGDRSDRQERSERRDRAQPDRGRSEWMGRGAPAPAAAEAPQPPRAQPAPDRRDWNGRGDQDRRVWDRQSGDRRDRDRRDDRRHWERGRYPPAYASSHRYRHAWRPPSGFYLRSWSFGEVYPRSWYGQGYWIVDAWQYDLPLPPPGYEWVRSGPDALLIDQFSGRIVQIVRDVFWY